MPEIPADPTVAQQVELAVRQLEWLSILPCAAGQFLSLLAQTSQSELAEIIESEPALTVRFLSLMHQQGLAPPDEIPSIRQQLDGLPKHIIRDAFFSIGVYQPSDQTEQRGLLRKQLIEHCLAVACCARDIAETVPLAMDPYLAYLAGLLHDIGKLALDEAMPRSFAGIIEQAKSQQACSCTIERQHLGLDHTILGKHLAVKWHLPGQIIPAIWLHHSDTGKIAQNMPEAKIAQVVQLADLLARQCGIGQSGSYDAPDSAGQIAEELGISTEQSEQIKWALAEKVTEKSKVLGLDLPNATENYYKIIHTTAAQLAREHTKLSVENSRIQSALSHIDFAMEFLSNINSNTTLLDIAEDFAVRWQRFFQTGPVCLYLVPSTESKTIKAVVAEDPSQAKAVALSVPFEGPVIPQDIVRGFAVLDAYRRTNWVFEQLEVDFDISQTKVAPLLSGGKAIGAIVFEFRYPVEPEEFEEKFKTAACIGGAVLAMAAAGCKNERLAEQFAQLITGGEQIQPQVAETAEKEIQQQEVETIRPLEALAEMAGGAAHELNNPLSVISGRAQMLAESEEDPEKKRMLKQIQENARELSGIIDDLMSFAEPPQPRPTETDIKQMLGEATQLAAQKQKAEQLDIKVDVAEGLEDVFVDSAQIVSAIANIFSNSLESYDDGSGPIEVTAEPDESGEFVKMSISDTGCGMDAETLKKAAQPFFSAKPAGRKRGMGLAYAARLIELNNGSLNITSRPGEGTTVTILLPCK